MGHLESLSIGGIEEKAFGWGSKGAAGKEDATSGRDNDRIEGGVFRVDRLW